jgi:pimeloyl-ACP methyl ester carboxylesterase
MARAVDAIRLRRYALLGFNSGATIARYLAAEHADRVTGLVIGPTEIPHHPDTRPLLSARAILDYLIVKRTNFWRLQ